MKNRVVLLLGASGLVGSKVLEELLLREDVAEIRVLVRKPLNLTHAKVKERITDFSSLEPLDDFFKWMHCIVASGLREKNTGFSGLQSHRLWNTPVRWGTGKSQGLSRNPRGFFRWSQCSIEKLLFENQRGNGRGNRAFRFRLLQNLPPFHAIGNSQGIKAFGTPWSKAYALFRSFYLRWKIPQHWCLRCRTCYVP